MPGIDFLEYEEHGAKLPADNEYTDYRHQCWRIGPPVDKDDDSVATESETSSTDSEAGQ